MTIALSGLPTIATSKHSGVRRLTTLCVWHSTAGGTMRSSMEWCARPDSTSGFHFGIDRDGTIMASTPHGLIAWHAGLSAWPVPAGGVPPKASVNSRSIGIEFANLNVPSRVVGFERITDRQLAAAMDLAQALAVAYPALACAAAHVRHRDISPGRKTDPDPDTLDWPAFQARLRTHLETA